MDPVTIAAVLLAIVAGGAGEVGNRLLAAARNLVSRPIRSDHASSDSDAQVRHGQEEFAALEHAPSDQARALTLAAALVERAQLDPDFRQQLEAWWQQASQVLPGEGNVTNTISGGTQYGPVLQGRDFTSITFGSTSDSDGGRD